MEGLRKWGKSDGDHPPERLRAVTALDDRMRKVQENQRKAQTAHAFDASQVAARDRFAGQQLVGSSSNARGQAQAGTHQRPWIRIKRTGQAADTLNKAAR